MIIFERDIGGSEAGGGPQAQQGNGPSHQFKPNGLIKSWNQFCLINIVQLCLFCL